MADSVIIVIRCPYEGCPEKGQGKWVPIPRAFLGKLSQPGADDKVMGPTCGHVWSLSDKEKANIAKSLADGTL